MKLYASNLSSKTAETELKAAFAAHGSVEECRITKDKTPGDSKASGIIKMPNEAEARAAITALNDSQLGGNKIQVKESNPERKPDQKANARS